MLQSHHPIDAGSHSSRTLLRGQQDDPSAPLPLWLSGHPHLAHTVPTAPCAHEHTPAFDSAISPTRKAFALTYPIACLQPLVRELPQTLSSV